MKAERGDSLVISEMLAEWNKLRGSGQPNSVGVQTMLGGG